MTMLDMITAPPSDEAIDAMVLALQSNGVNIYAIHARDEPVTPSMMRAVLATALVAGAEHLQLAHRQDPDATGKPCKIHAGDLVDAFCPCGHIVAAHTKTADGPRCDLCAPLPERAVRQCRICGCTDEEACPGGCSWSQPEICSTCAARQRVADDQYLTTLRAQEEAAQLQTEQARTSLKFLAESRALIAEQHEVAKMQREHIVGETWRVAVACAARDAGSPTQTDGAPTRIKDDAEWFAHLLGNPPVVF